MDAVKKFTPTVIIHLAALTDVDRCEREPELADQINAMGTYHMALAAKEVGAKLVYISTAGVFDGTKKDPYTERDIPNPQNAYGRSKYRGEVFVQEVLEDYLIARVCWMFGGGPVRDKKFIAKVIAQLDHKEIHAVDDQFGSPTFGKDLVAAIKTLILKDERGIVHLANKGVCSRFEYAKEIVKVAGGHADVIPVPASFFKLDAIRTANEGLASRLNLTRPWQEAVREYITTEWL